MILEINFLSWPPGAQYQIPIIRQATRARRIMLRCYSTCTVRFCVMICGSLKERKKKKLHFKQMSIVSYRGYESNTKLNHLKLLFANFLINHFLKMVFKILSVINKTGQSI